MATTTAATATTLTSSKRISSNSRRLILLLLTSGFFITGLLFDYMPMIVDNQIKRTVELATNEEIQSIWSRPPVDFHSYYWLYDILNSEKFLAGEEKVRVRRVGPYHFSSRMEKKILEVSQNKFRISYNSTRRIQLDEANSASLDEPLVLLNPVFASLVSGAREMTRNQDAQSRQMMLSSVGRMAERFNETLFINATARSALIGRRLLIVEKLMKMAQTFGFDIDLPEIARTKLFGYVSVTNGTWDGPFEIYSGYRASMNSLGDIISYQGRKRLTEFQGKCNRLQASAGELRPMPLLDNQTLEMFQPRFCRIVHLTPTGTRKLKEGQAIAYELSADDFMSARQNADNRCFCLSNKTSNDYCSLNGALEVGPCSYHSPIVVTVSSIRPDERITGSVLNWDPDMLRGDIELVPKGDDRSQILVLKRLGVPLQGDITLTLFMRVIRDPTFRQTSQVPEESFVPILTVRERGMIPPKLAQIIINLESFLSLTTHLKVVMYLTAVVLLCSLTGHYYTASSSGAPNGGPRITPSGEPESEDEREREREASQRQQTRSERNSAGPGGGSRVALPASGAASERANSADSSRSQPPSRVSHSSLDVVSADEPAGDVGPRQANGSSDQLISADSLRAAEQTKSRAKADGQQQQQQQKRRIFSKVDEEAGLQSESSWRTKRGQDSRRPTDSETANDPADSSSPSEAGTAGAGSGLRDSAAAAAAPTEGPPGKRRNWFMKVCSNFVRMLNGIRTSINDAGQLDINENDYQDKQLEMLAGKIDSWYQSSPVTPPDSSLAGSSAAGQPAPAQMVAAMSEADAQESAASRRLIRTGEPARQANGAESSGTARQEAAKMGREEGEPVEEKAEMDAARRQRMNRDGKDEDEDDAGIGSGAEETPWNQSPTEGSFGGAQPATKASGMVAAVAVAAGPQISTAASTIPQLEQAADQAPAPRNAESDSLLRASRQVSGAPTAAATRSDKNLADAETAPSGGHTRDARSEEKEADQSKDSIETEKGARRDSVKSNATVINKRGNNTTSSSKSTSNNSEDADTDEGGKVPIGPANSTQEDPVAPAQRKPPPLAKVDTSKLREAGGGGDAFVAASAAGESNNELARDKKAALESVEKALAAAVTTAPANRLEGD